MPDEARAAHVSVLLDEVLSVLAPRGGVGFRALDCTVGAGGHAFALLESSQPDGTLVGLDADPTALELAAARLKPFEGRFSLLQGNFGDLGELELRLKPFELVQRNLGDLGEPELQLAEGRFESVQGNLGDLAEPELQPSQGRFDQEQRNLGDLGEPEPQPSEGRFEVEQGNLGDLGEPELQLAEGRFESVQGNLGDPGEVGLGQFDAVLMDLGLSSMQLETSGRGFSLQRDEPLDMRFDPNHGESAAELLQRVSEGELERILREYGEERRARGVARRILDRRPITRTGELVAAVTSVLGPSRGRIHPATRTFQALRIAVNGELDVLDRGLDAAVDKLKPNGRLAVISFHSLEDRIVKWRFRAWADAGRVRVLTKKPIVASDAEQQTNPRSRSAKLRAVERLA